MGNMTKTIKDFTLALEDSLISAIDQSETGVTFVSRMGSDPILDVTLLGGMWEVALFETRDRLQRIIRIQTRDMDSAIGQAAQLAYRL
tara:strand:+ start:449 stop:712 length:264 start_codon:yes stop_codon:yes gene_type:complete